DAGLYRLLLPRSLGGGEMDPLAYFDVIEALAQADSAAAWSVLISTSTMAITARGLPDEILAAMFTSPRQTIMAGSGPPKGRALPVPGGYRLTGRWTQGSNILLAGWIHVGCHLYDGDQPRRGSDGRPVYLRCVLPASDAKAVDTWRTTIQAKVARAEALVGSGRAYVREATRDLWETVCRGERPSPGQRAIYRLAIAQAMTNASEAVDLMYSAGGASAIYATSRLDRCLRDAHTAAAHVWVAPDTFELAGRLLLGLDPGSPTI